jgi:hypothetical protein
VDRGLDSIAQCAGRKFLQVKTDAPAVAVGNILLRRATSYEQTSPVGNRSYLQKTFDPSAVAVPAIPLAGSSDPAPLARSAQTALEHSQHLGWAEIRHPFHPLRGQRFEVLNKRRVAGVDTLILRECKRSSFSIARDWTDWAYPSGYDSFGWRQCRFEAKSLCGLATLVEQLIKRNKEVE